MAKEDRLQFRVSKGTKLILSEYCSSRRNSSGIKLKLTDLIELALQDYFSKKGEYGVYNFMSVADRYLEFEGLSERDVLELLKTDEEYRRIVLDEK